MENHYFKTAEFAALCGVRKDTLLHYDHIGLLKPQWVGENGYRYYAAQQLRTYDLIAALRRLGTPLAEIRDYLTRRSPQALLALLEEKEAQLAEERRRLEAVSRLLQTAMDTTRLAQQVRPGEIRLEELPPAHCAVVEAPDFTGGKFEEARYLLHIRQLLAWAREQAPSPGLRGHHLPGEHGEGGLHGGLLLLPGTPGEPRGGPSGCGRGGPMRCSTTRGPTSRSMPPAAGWEWVHAQGYPVDGDLYEENLVDYTTSGGPQGIPPQAQLEDPAALTPLFTGAPAAGIIERNFAGEEGTQWNTKPGKPPGRLP